MPLVEIVHDDIDHERLLQEYVTVLTDHNLYDEHQISITSISGNNDWFCSVGKINKLPHPERYYSKLNQAFVGTYIEELLNRYPQYYRWRGMKLDPDKIYSVHDDHNNMGTNYRLHIPVLSNEKSFLCFYDQRPCSGQKCVVQYEHLATGNSYQVDTSGLHTAVNFGKKERFHIVGIRYENSNNRSH